MATTIFFQTFPKLFLPQFQKRNSWIITTYTDENDIVLDNTAGVFTTAIACLETNRKYIVMEKEREYYNKGLKRILEWEQEQKTKLF